MCGDLHPHYDCQVFHESDASKPLHRDPGDVTALQMKLNSAPYRVEGITATPFIESFRFSLFWGGSRVMGEIYQKYDRLVKMKCSAASTGSVEGYTRLAGIKVNHKMAPVQTILCQG